MSPGCKALGAAAVAAEAAASRAAAAAGEGEVTGPHSWLPLPTGAADPGRRRSFRRASEVKVPAEALAARGAGEGLSSGVHVERRL